MDKNTNFYKMFAENKGKYTTDDIRWILAAAGYKYHHHARRRGYVPSKSPYVEKYKGRFGEGWVILVPNNEAGRKSNNYHDIIYYV